MSRSELRSDAVIETHRALWDEQDGLCAHCGVPMVLWLGQLAHVLPQDKTMMRRYGAEIIHHRLNLRLVCCLLCNARVSRRNDPMFERRHVARIREAIERGAK